jgi:hypothetical protein
MAGARWKVDTSLALTAGIQVFRNASPVGWFKGHSAEALSRQAIIAKVGIILIKEIKMTYEQHKFQIRTDPSVSYWLKAALEALDERDPVDAYNDAQALARVQQVRDSETNREWELSKIAAFRKGVKK